MKAMEQLGDTKSEILDRAAELLQTRGYNGFSYRDISSPMGVKNAAIHYHYPSKGDLAMALVDRYTDILRTATRDFMKNGGSASKQLDNLFRFTLSECKCGRLVCPVGAFSVDFENLPETVKAAASRFHDATMKWLTRVLEVGRQQGEVRFEGTSDGRALALLSSLQGARQIGRMMGMEAVTRIIEQERQALGV